jgi:hypothetical protein
MVPGPEQEILESHTRSLAGRVAPNERVLLNSTLMTLQSNTCFPREGKSQVGGASIESTLLWFDFFGVEVEIATTDPGSRDLLLGDFGFFETRRKNPALRYVVCKTGDGSFELVRDTQTFLSASDDGDLLFQVEKEITIEIQKRRPDLYFLHAGVLDYNGLGLLLVANSGGGKSTTTWALSHHGFRYLSDELAPIDLKTLEVLPYSHALNLKRDPPSPYSLPNETLRTSRTIHVPAFALPGGSKGVPTCLGAIFFVSYRPDVTPRATPISRTEAAARLFANALNPLVHPGEGLDGVLEIAARCSSFELVTNDLAQTCALVKQTIERVERGRTS